MGTDSAGGVVRKSFYGRTRQEAEDKAAAWLQAHPDGPPPPALQAPLNDLLATWVETCIKPPIGKQSTYDDYLAKIRLHIAPRIGQRALGELTTHHVNAWLRELYEATGKGRTVEKCYQIVRAALAYAVENETLAKNPAEHARPPRYEKRQEQRLSLNQARALVEAAYGRLDLRQSYTTSDRKVKHFPAVDPRLGFLYELAVFLGLRRGELLALRYSDLQGERLSIARQVDNRGREQPYTKTAASRRVVDLGEFLGAWRAHRVRQQSEHHGEGWKPDGLLFPTTTGAIMLPSNLHRHFKTVLAAAGAPAIRLHDLRHTAASLMIDAGASPSAVALVLGHRGPRMVMERYSHGDDAEAREAVQRSRRRAGGGGGG